MRGAPHLFGSGSMLARRTKVVVTGVLMLGMLALVTFDAPRPRKRDPLVRAVVEHQVPSQHRGTIESAKTSPSSAPPVRVAPSGEVRVPSQASASNGAAGCGSDDRCDGEGGAPSYVYSRARDEHRDVSPSDPSFDPEIDREGGPGDLHIPEGMVYDPEVP